MALLTAEDVLNKAFSKTKYREGFDQDEVDDFLDEVANSIAALTAERDDLQQRLAQAQAGGVVAPASVPTAATADATQPPSESLLQAATDPNPPSATTMLAMAQKLHDEYVQAGEEARDRLIDEGKVKAETIVEQAEKDARARMQDLEGERADLESRIDDLRRFERDYRGHLRNYLENLLGDLEHNASKVSAGPVGTSDSESDSAAEETQPEADSEPPAAPPIGDSFAASESPSGDFPDSDSPFGDTQQPQGEPSPFGAVEPEGEPSPFGAVEPSEPERSPFLPVQDNESPAQDNEFPAPPSKDDESGENPTDAPRWNF